ncbi:MAG: hypothetical protein D6689_05935 [Deltaproteobacteria bacterium]|nr:MAG: hypothetical protein D6689_05935 [Deltaproteobacteria bacterium]
MTRTVAGVALSAIVLAACTGAFDPDEPAVPGADAGAVDTPDAQPVYDELDKARAQARFQTTTDLMRYVFAPGCAAETNECHSNEDYPDLHTEGNLWNLRYLPCNLGVGERNTVEDFCEALGDEIEVTDGANAGWRTRIGSITLVTDADGAFQHYEVRVQTAPPAGQTDAQFRILRDGAPVAALGGGGGLQLTAGSTTLRVTDADAIPDPVAVRQGDENQNGVFGDGSGVLVRPGDARASYLVRRLLGAETTRIRMPLNDNADNPTELNRYLTPDEMYAVMSWINCMRPEDDVYAPIRYDCPENADNEGRW